MTEGDSKERSKITMDTFWEGALKVWQPAKGQGYRFNLDPVLLYGFAPPANEILEFGAGCGILSLLMLGSAKTQKAVAVEIQAQLAEAAKTNAFENGMQNRLNILHGDLRELDLPKVDAVIFNPPYFAQGTGRVSPESGRAAARHEVHGTLKDFVRVGVRSIREGGYLAAILPVNRYDDIEHYLSDEGWGIALRRAVIPREGEAANHWMLLAREGAQDTMTEPALVVHTGAGRDYSDEVEVLLVAACPLEL